MESKVKASINLKEGIFQIEGPKEFVRNYLDHIIKNCKPFSKSFPKPETTAEEQNKIMQLEKSTASEHGLLSAGCFTAALWIYIVAKDSRWSWIGLTVIGAIFALSGLYFLCINKIIHNEKRQKIINIASFFRVNINHIAWCLGLVLLGKELVKTQLNWAAIPGVVLMCVGLLALLDGILKTAKLKRNKPKNA